MIGALISTLIADYQSLYSSNNSDIVQYAKTNYIKYGHIRKNTYMLETLQKCWIRHVRRLPKLRLVPFYRIGIADSLYSPSKCFENPVKTFIQMCEQIPLADLVPALVYIHADANQAYQNYQQLNSPIPIRNEEMRKKLLVKETILKELIQLMNKTIPSSAFVDFLITNKVERRKAVDIFLWYP